MGKLIVLRHGENVWNARNVVVGRTDIPLNEKGFLQAEEAAEKLREIRIDRVFVSPLTRTRQTAEVILSGRDPGEGEIPVIIEERLIEQNFGEYEEIARDDPRYQAAKRKYFCRLPGGESFMDLAGRLYPFLEEIKKNYAGETVLLVTHGGTGRVICNYFRDMDNEEFVRFHMENCGYEIFDF